MTQEEVAQRVSKSRPAVANSLRLLSLPAELMGFVLRGEISAGSARALLSLKNEEAMRSAANMVVDNEMSVREVEALIKKLDRERPDKDASKPSKPRNEEVDYLLEAQNRLTASLGRRVTIKPGKDKGKIEIEYYSQDDFDVLFYALSSTKDSKNPEVSKK